MSIPDSHRASRGPAAARIFALIRDRILSGSLPPGEQMISAQQIAREMGVSRTVVKSAFDQLIAEGYLEPGPRSSLRVAGGAALRTPAAKESASVPPGKFVPFRFDLIDFRPGVPDLSRFPARLWQRIAGDVWRQMTPLDLSYSQPEGRAELRREITRYLTAFRCSVCSSATTGGSTGRSASWSTA
jgi:GntR family transcriptional regulator / MocR family aminotransferase